MKTDKSPKKITTKPAATKKAVVPKISEKYFEGIGRRKEAVARVRLFQVEKDIDTAQNFFINGKLLKEYFTLSELQNSVMNPIGIVGLEKKVRLNVKTSGGGIRGQAEAVRLGVSRSIVKLNEENRKTLRDNGLLTRDDRIVERKKAGLKKARRAPQWQKR